MKHLNDFNQLNESKAELALLQNLLDFCQTKYKIKKNCDDKFMTMAFSLELSRSVLQQFMKENDIQWIPEEEPKRAKKIKDVNLPNFTSGCGNSSGCGNTSRPTRTGCGNTSRPTRRSSGCGGSESSC